MKVWFVIDKYEDDEWFIDPKDLVLFASESSANSHCVNKQFDSKQAHEARERDRYSQWLAEKEAWDCLEENGVKASKIFPWFTEFKSRDWKRLPLEIRSVHVHP